jgi:outer membrane protein OmpA-like peptidoglycan-associated protein
MPSNSIQLLTATLACLLCAGTASAETRESSPGYASDQRGNIVHSGAGECVHTGSFQNNDATVVGCDNYQLDTQVEIIKGQGMDAASFITFPQAELFAFDSAELSTAGKTYISDYRKELKDDMAKAYSVTVIGYTDSTGKPTYNMDLSKRRADAVSSYLASIGVPADKIHTLGRGENDPIAPNDTAENRAQNRRVEVIVVAQPRALDTLIFPSVALFERRSADITDTGATMLKTNLQDARDQLKRAVYIEIVGHTDDVGDDAYNLELSDQRAAAVGEYLVDAGVDASKIVMVGMGESLPIASNATDEGRAENRRVEVLVLGRTK